MFTEISNLLKEGEMLRMNIFKTGEGLVVTVLPKSAEVKDPAAEQLIPLNLKGSPAELDAGFIEAVRRPLTTSTTLMTNMAEYEKSVEKAGREARAEKDRKEAEAAEKAGKSKEALEAYAKALKLDGKNIKIQLKINNLKMKTAGCGDLFSSLPAAPVKEEPPVEEPDERDFAGLFRYFESLLPAGQRLLLKEEGKKLLFQVWFGDDFLSGEVFFIPIQPLNRTEGVLRDIFLSFFQLFGQMHQLERNGADRTANPKYWISWRLTGKDLSTISFQRYINSPAVQGRSWKSSSKIIFLKMMRREN